MYHCTIAGAKDKVKQARRAPRLGVQNKDNWTTCGYFYLLAFGDKGCAAVLIPRCGQVGKGTQVFAFRVIPWTKKG